MPRTAQVAYTENPEAWPAGQPRNQRSEWDAGCRFDFENPEHR